MNWLQKRLRKWLGIDQLSKKTTDIWWDLNDAGHGLKTVTADHDKILALLTEVQAYPEDFTWEEGKLTWKSPNTQSKKTWFIATNYDTPYKCLKSIAMDETRERH